VDLRDAPAVAHLLRRTGFGPAPGQVEAAGPYADALDAVLAAAVDDGAEMPDPTDDDLYPAVVWWVRRMASGEHALHEKLVWFWHSHLTSSGDKASADMMGRQHNLLRRHALGNFRELLRLMVVDAAMLVFLDGAGSDAAAPNENLARELMELFTLGRGEYTEADVKAMAKALAGYTVDWDSEAVGFDEEAATSARLTILDVTGQFDAERVVDVLCDRPATAAFVAAKLHRFLVGTDPDAGRRAELATTFRDAGWEVRPLVEAILRDPGFAAARMSRPRLPVEWFVATHLALGIGIGDDDIWSLGDLGQMPLYPPNVAGWPIGPQWVGAGRQLLKASLALAADDDSLSIDLGGGPAADRATAALAHCGLFEASATTHAALAAAAGRHSATDGGDRLLVALALASPEASCA
jgi:uncharacterized protein (DUF1800 family)